MKRDELPPGFVPPIYRSDALDVWPLMFMMGALTLVIILVVVLALPEITDSLLWVAGGFMGNRVVMAARQEAKIRRETRDLRDTL